MDIQTLWSSVNEAEWEEADKRYDLFVKPENRQLEDELEAKMPQVRELEDVQRLGDGKYTAPNRYATTSKRFREAYEKDRAILHMRVQSLLAEPDKSDAELMGFKAKRIEGLGYAGASGLLALMYPELYGTIDQFVVLSLRQIRNLPEYGALQKLKPANLGLQALVMLTDLYRRKSKDLNELFHSSKWTPRKIDRVLWALRPSSEP